MPNWCNCDLVVRGKAATLKKFVRENKGVAPTYSDSVGRWAEALSPAAQAEAKANREATKPLSFHQSRPVPKSVLKKGFNDAGYDWQIENWGTKWNPAEVQIEEDYAAGYVRYTFVTAWSPPEGWVRAAAKKYPTLRLRLEYDEPGVHFEGALEMRGSVVIHEVYHE